MQAGLTLEQSQRQVLSQEMLQSLQLLSLSTLDLRTSIFNELHQNPILEIAKDPLEKKRHERIKKHFAHTKTASRDEHQKFIESIPNSEETLQEHLLKQFALLKLKPHIHELGKMLIQNLNTSGFHSVAPQEILTLYNNMHLDFMVLPDEFFWLLAEIQGLDPIGCCTSDSLESLKVQIQHSLEASPKSEQTLYQDAIDILTNHRELFRLSSKKAFFTELKSSSPRYSKITLENVNQILNLIKNFSPAPGEKFSSEEKNVYAIPEVFVLKTSEGFKVEVNSIELPVLRFSKLLTESSQNTSPELKDAIKRAHIFIEAIQFRRETMLKLVTSLVLMQSDFFLSGPEKLKPLTQAAIAEELKVHPSTISRTVTGKYLQCDYGVFELKYFFSNSQVSLKTTAKDTETANETSSVKSSTLTTKNAIVKMIKSLLDNEPNLTDEKIAKQLQEKGIKISRRTVNKYRHSI